MKFKTAFILLGLLMVGLAIGAYIQRGEWGIGAEWVLPILLGLIIPFEDREE